MRPALLLALVGLLSLGGVPGAALAQGGPSSEDIIRSLRPGGMTRGLRLPSVEQPPAAPEARPWPSSERPPVASRPLPSAGLGTGQQPRTGDAPAVNLNVQFRTNSAELTPAALRTLDELGRALASSTLAPFHFRIEGHTDTVGSKEFNKTLSERRAQAVVEYLAARHGVDRGRMEAVGLGEDAPLVTTGDEREERRNRRVQVVNLGG